MALRAAILSEFIISTLSEAPRAPHLAPHALLVAEASLRGLLLLNTLPLRIKIILAQKLLFLL
jgi:hypothetical protein